MLRNFWLYLSLSSCAAKHTILPGKCSISLRDLFKATLNHVGNWIQTKGPLIISVVASPLRQHLKCHSFLLKVILRMKFRLIWLLFYSDSVGCGLNSRLTLHLLYGPDLGHYTVFFLLRYKVKGKNR